jgi:hypothetical protein
VIGPEAGEPWIDLAIERLEDAWRNAIPRRVEQT